MIRRHSWLITALLVGAGGFAAVLAWGIRMRGGECSQYTPPGWLLGAVLGWGLLLMLGAFFGSVAFEGTPKLQLVYVLVGVLEMAAAVAVVLYLVTKSLNAYSCG